MKISWPTVRLDREGWLTVAGGAASIVVAAVLFSRFGIDGSLSRDESIYVYGGQQLTHGVAPYASIFDPKGPIATLFCGLGVGLGKLFGTNDVLTIRALFYLCALLCALAIYVLVVDVWRSRIGGLAGAVVFASYEGFARDALAGPDAKTPGVLFLILCMWLAIRRQWFWAAFLGSLTFLDWQPFLIFPIIPLLYAALTERERRRRAVGLAAAGAAIPIVVTFVYFAAAGAFGDFMASAFGYPLTGVKRPPETVVARVRHIFSVVHEYYAFSGVLLWVGAVLLVIIAADVVVRGRPAWRTTLADPVLVVIFLGALWNFGYALTDFQSYPDVYALLPFPAIGIGAAVALALRRLRQPTAWRAVASLVGAALVVLTVLSAIWFQESPYNDGKLRNERAAGCALQFAIVPGTPLWSLGDPMPLVVTGRTNPDPFIYLDAGVASWKVHHTSGGFDGWTSQIAAAGPSAVVSEAWTGRYLPKMSRYLSEHGYRHYWIGLIRAFLTPEGKASLEANGIHPTGRRTLWPVRTDGTPYRVGSCGIG